MPETPLPDDLNKDLGFGGRIAERSRRRLLNHDGSFNVQRRGLPFLRSMSLYHSLLTMSWWKFQAVVILFYFLTNAAFAAGYILCGTGAFEGSQARTLSGRFAEAFFFSVQTLATIGYGRISPHNLAANILVSAEALAGLLGFALATGLLFSRFSRPSAKLLFSARAVIAPYRGITGFMFRVANERSNELLEVEATVVLSQRERPGGPRRFRTLTLERSKVSFLPLHWVIVHPIDETSPLHGVTRESFEASDAEFLVLLTGIDETSSQAVHARSSYHHSEIVWEAKFADMFRESPDGTIAIDLRKIHDVEPVRAAVY
ncbi:MAG: hypothetical protein HYR60_29860 [Acidobacteria bacterium]|nr:hypothetical protein [Acidobacteriota bacterium]